MSKKARQRQETSRSRTQQGESRHYSYDEEEAFYEAAAAAAAAHAAAAHAAQQQQRDAEFYAYVALVFKGILGLVLRVLGLGGDAKEQAPPEHEAPPPPPPPPPQPPPPPPPPPPKETWREAFVALKLEPEGCTESEVRSAFRKGSLLCHPDKHPDDPAAESRFTALCTARDEALKHLRGGAETPQDDPAQHEQNAADAREAAKRQEKKMNANLAAEQARFEAEMTKATAKERKWEAGFEKCARTYANRAYDLRRADPYLRANAWRSTEAQRAAAAEMGPPPSPESPGEAYRESTHPAAVAVRTRAVIILQTFIVMKLQESGSAMWALREDLGCRTTLLHHAAKADWVEGVEAIVCFPGVDYASLVLALDDDGKRPADVAGKAVAKRLEELTQHACEAAAKASTATAKEAEAAAAQRAASLRTAERGLMLAGVAFFIWRFIRS